MGATITAAVALPMAAVIKSAKDFETAFANVVKTVEGFDVDAFGNLNEGAREFRENILDLSREIPETADKLANIAAIGGQFGVAQQDLLGFTETVAKLGVAIDGIEAETAAASLAQIANVTREGEGAFKRYADVLVDLGNKGNSTEGEILEFAKRLAGAGSQAGLTGDQIFGLGAAMANVGLNAEAGGTAMSRLISNMSKAGSQGAEASQKFADFAGRMDATVASGQAFAQLFQRDAKQALQLFFDGLSDAAKKGENLQQILTDLGVNEVRQRDTMLRLAGAQGELAKQFTNAANAARDGTALNEEARKKYATFDNQLQLFMNTVRLVAIEIGTPLLRALNRVLDATKPLQDEVVALARSFADLNPAVQGAALALGLGTGLTGVLLLLGGQVAKSITDISRLVSAIKALTATQAAASVVQTASSVQQLGAAASSSTAGVVRMTGATTAWGYSMQVAAPAATEAAKATGGFTLATAAAYAPLAAIAVAVSAAKGALDEWLHSLGAAGDAARVITDGFPGFIRVVRDYALAWRDLDMTVKEAGETLAKGAGGQAGAFSPLKPALFRADAVKLPTAEEVEALARGPQAALDKVAQLKAALADLSPEVRRQIDDLRLYGQTNEEIAKALRLSEDVVKAYQATSAAAAKQQKELAKEIQVTTEVFTALEPPLTLVDGALGALAAHNSAEWADEFADASKGLRKELRELADAIDLRKETQGLSQGFVAAVKSAKQFSREIEDLHEAAKGADPSLAAMYAELERFKRLDFAGEMEEAVVTTDEFRQVILAVNPAMAEMLRNAESVTGQQGAAKEKTEDWTSSLKDLSTAMSNLKELGGGLGFAAEFVAQADVALQAFGKVRAGIAEFAKTAGRDLSKAFSEMAAGIASGIGGLFGATDPGKDLSERLFGGALQGASLGASAATLGATIAGFTAKGAATAGVWGAAAGVIVGIMVAVFRGRATRREMEIVGQEWGVAISKGLYDKIKAAQKDFGGDRVAASLFNFSDILKEAGGLNDLNFDDFTAKLRDVFVMLETGKFTTEQALHVMAENFDAFAKHVIDSGEFASQGFLDILNQNIASGLNAPEIQQFIQGRAGVVGQGLAAMLGPVVEGAAKVGDRVREAFKAVDDLIKNGKQGTGEYEAAVAELNEALRHQREVAAGAIGDLENIGVVALATFTRARASGLSFIEALNAIGPALDVLIQAQKDLGVEGTNSAINQLMHYRELANQFPVLVNAASALGPTLVALQQTGGLTTDALKAMEDQGLRTFNRLRDAGFTEQEALAQIADFLKQVEKAHKLLGTPIDENTQRMIDQARAAGLLGDEAVDATTQQRRGFELVTRAINQLIITLGGVPIAIDDISRAIDNIPRDVTIDFDYRYPNGQPPGTIPGGQTATGPSGLPPGWDPEAVGQATASAAAAYSGAGMETVIEVPVSLDSEVVTRVVARRLPEFTELYGGPSSRTTV